MDANAKDLSQTQAQGETETCFESKRDEGVWVAAINGSVQFVNCRFCTTDPQIIEALRGKVAFGIVEI